MICHFSSISDRKMEKSVVLFTHEQNIICGQTQLDNIAHEQTIICRQLFAGHVVGFRPMKRKKNLHRMIICFPDKRLLSIFNFVLQATFLQAADWPTTNFFGRYCYFPVI